MYRRDPTLLMIKVMTDVRGVVVELKRGGVERRKEETEVESRRHRGGNRRSCFYSWWL